ncbi:DUF551 domain-containing protein [Escherichia coli]|nr:DUF551 domain-containing protein [Escherichia coli]
MTTITKERLLTIKQWRETYGPDSNVVLPAEEAEELARIALASLEAEPVAWDHEWASCITCDGPQNFERIIEHEAPPEWAIKSGQARNLIPLYTAPPAPVSVPTFDEWLELRGNKPLGWVKDAMRESYDACRGAILQSGNFRENKNSSTNNFREIAETSTNYPVIPSEVLSAILKVAKIRADFDDFDGDRRGIGDCLDEAEQELIVTINKYASQLAVEPVVPAVLERLRTIVADPRALPRRKEWVSGQQYSYVLLENVEAMVDEACHAAMLQGSQPVSQTYKFPVNTPCQDAPAHIWLQTAGVWPEDGELSELTWCSHNQHHDDTLYVRADLVNGNYPVTPDGWISCSERMPENIPGSCKEYLVFDGLNNKVHHDYWVVPDGDSAPVASFWNHYGAHVTHWMPLPEPPQEAK